MQGGQSSQFHEGQHVPLRPPDERYRTLPSSPSPVFPSSVSVSLLSPSLRHFRSLPSHPAPLRHAAARLGNQEQGRVDDSWILIYRERVMRVACNRRCRFLCSLYFFGEARERAHAALLSLRCPPSLSPPPFGGARPHHAPQGG